MVRYRLEFKGVYGEKKWSIGKCTDRYPQFYFSDFILHFFCGLHFFVDCNLVTFIFEDSSYTHKESAAVYGLDRIRYCYDAVRRFIYGS